MTLLLLLIFFFSFFCLSLNNKKLIRLDWGKRSAHLKFKKLLNFLIFYVIIFFILKTKFFFKLVINMENQKVSSKMKTSSYSNFNRNPNEKEMNNFNDVFYLNGQMLESLNNDELRAHAISYE